MMNQTLEIYGDAELLGDNVECLLAPNGSEGFLLRK
jgi:hypothetical protein